MDHGTRQEVRQARLRRACAERYPMLPVRWWTSAARLAAIVASASGRGPAPRAGRVLPGHCFEFRGGSPRGPESIGLRTRAGELPHGPPAGAPQRRGSGASSLAALAWALSGWA